LAMSGVISTVMLSWWFEGVWIGWVTGMGG